jgi:hypothetical protein
MREGGLGPAAEVKPSKLCNPMYLSTQLFHHIANPSKPTSRAEHALFSVVAIFAASVLSEVVPSGHGLHGAVSVAVAFVLQ